MPHETVTSDKKFPLGRDFYFAATLFKGSRLLLLYASNGPAYPAVRARDVVRRRINLDVDAPVAISCDPAWLRGLNAIRSIETPRVHHASRRRGGRVAA